MKTRITLSSLALAAALGLSSLAFADVTGTVKLDGKAPQPKPIQMNVPGCQGHGQVFDEKVVVGKDNGLANVVVNVKKEEGGPNLPPPANADNKKPVILDQKGCQYVPHVVAAEVGQPIKVANSDPLFHNVHTQPDKNQAQNIAEPNKTPGVALKPTTDPEYFHVKCDVHPWMSAWVAVIDNPYFAVTDKDGKFTLPKGLPDGKYTLHVWHEKFGEQDVPVEVKGGDANVDITVKQQ